MAPADAHTSMSINLTGDTSAAPLHGVYQRKAISRSVSGFPDDDIPSAPRRSNSQGAPDTTSAALTTAELGGLVDPKSFASPSKNRRVRDVDWWRPGNVCSRRDRLVRKLATWVTVAAGLVCMVVVVVGLKRNGLMPHSHDLFGVPEEKHFVFPDAGWDESFLMNLMTPGGDNSDFPMANHDLQIEPPHLLEEGEVSAEFGEVRVAAPAMKRNKNQHAASPDTAYSVDDQVHTEDAKAGADAAITHDAAADTQADDTSNTEADTIAKEAAAAVDDAPASPVGVMGAAAPVEDRPNAGQGNDAPAQQPASMDPAAASSCVDLHERCGPWAEEGECTNNPDFMLGNADKELVGNCLRSCNACPATETAPEEIPEAETINQAENPAPEYEPVSNVARDQAQAAEVLPQAGSPDAKSGVLEASSDWAVEGATGAECIDKHERCKAWAEEGECEHNPDFMLGNTAKQLQGNCVPSCNACGLPTP